MVRRLRAADGRRRRASRRVVVRDARRQVDRVPPVGVPPLRRDQERRAGRPRERGATSTTPARCGRRTSSGSTCRWKIDPDGSMGIRQWFEVRRAARQPDQCRRVLRPHLLRGGARAGRGRSRGRPGSARVHARPRVVRRARPTRTRPTRSWCRPMPSPTAPRTSTGCSASRARSARSTDREESFAGTELAKLGDGSPAVEIDGEIKEGFPTPSKKLELFSTTLKEWGWPEYSTPKWIPSHVHWEDMDIAGNERILLPTFRIPTLIHTRSANSKWLNEISHRHPLWIHPSDAEKLEIEESGLVRITHPHRSLRDPGVADGGHPSGCGRGVAPHGPLASRREGRALVGRRQGDDRQRRNHLEAQAREGQRALRVVGPRHRADLVA